MDKGFPQRFIEANCAVAEVAAAFFNTLNKNGVPADAAATITGYFAAEFVSQGSNSRRRKDDYGD